MAANRFPARILARASGTRDVQHGLTLIEVLVALLLISIGVVGLLGVLAQWLPNSSDAENRNRAATLANQFASEMWVTGTVSGCLNASTPTDKICSDLSSNVAVATLAAGVPNPNYLPSGAVTVAAGATLNTAQISVTWVTPGTRFGTANASPTSTYTTQVMLP